MKSKKLISFLCAAAMTTSAFAGLTVASAAATPVWSFDGSSTDDWDGDVKPTVKTDEGSTDQYLDFLAGTGTKSNNTTFVLPTAAQLENDYVLEYDAFIHTGNGMGRLAQYTQLAFTGASPVQDSQDYGGDYAAEASPMMEGKNCDCHSEWNAASETGWGYASDIVSSLTNRIELQGKMLINYDGKNAPSINDGDAQIGDSKWVRVRNEVKDGKAKVTIADSNGTIVDGEEFAVSASKLSQIKMAFGRADTTHFIPTTPANIKLDNIKVYDGIAGTPAFSTADLRKSAVVATPIPAPEKVAGPAPKFYAPESAEQVYTANFNGASTGEIGHVETAETEAKAIVNGMKVKLGNRPDGEDAKTYASIVKVADGDNAVRLSADKFSTNGRGPVVSLDNNIDLSDMTSGSAVMSFAVYLSKTDANGIERLFLFDNTDNVDGNGCARDVVAVITTEDIKVVDDEGNESYRYTAGEANIGIHVEPEMWHTIAVVATAGDSPVRVFVDGKYKEENDEGKNALSPALKVEMVGTGQDNKKYVTHLPMIGVENTKAYNEESGEGGTAYSTALIDNVLAYYVQGDLEPKNLPQTDGDEPTEPPVVKTPAPKHVANITYANGKASVSTEETEPFDGVLIAANYKADGTLEKIALTKELTGISSTAIEEAVAMAEGDKLMVWNNLNEMVPYGTYTVTAEQASATKAPANTPMPTPEVTDTPATDKPITSDTPATEAPTEAPTAAPKYAVTVATAENGTVTVDKTEAEEGATVTITAEPADGYLLGTITVKDADNGDVTVTDGKFTMPAKAVTVTTTFVADTALYRLKTKGLKDGQISYSLVADDIANIASVTAEEAAKSNVADFKTATEKTAAVPELAGWGYKHFAFTSMEKNGAFQAGRQSSAGVDTAVNGVYAAGVGNTGCNDAVSFILANSGKTVPTTGKIVYTFDAYVKITGGNAVKNHTFGLTTSADGSTVNSVASTTVANPATGSVTKKMVMTYSIDNKTYSISVDGTQVAAGKTETPVTGIYAQAGESYVNATISNLVVTVEDSDPVVNLTVTGAQEEVKDGETVVTPAETAQLDKIEAKEGETVTVTTKKNAGRKVTVTAKDEDEADVAVTAGDNGTYTFTMPAKAVTVTAAFARADIATIEVAGPRTVSSAATNKYTATVKDADGAVLDVAVTWSVTGGGDGTAIAADGTLTVADAEADQTALTIKATAEEKEGTLTANVTKATVYTITKADDLTGGSVATDKIVGIEGAEVTVTPTASTGYHVTAVTYTPAEGTAQTITPAEGVYKFTMPAANVTVSATFAKTDYAITNATAADAGGTISFTVGENTAATTAQMGDTVKVVGTSDDKELDTITVVPTTEGSTTTVTVTGDTFVMPAEPVTVTATFATPVPKFMEFADGKIKAVSVKAGDVANSTYAQLKKGSVVSTTNDGGSDGLTAGFDNPLVYKEGMLFATQAKTSEGKLASQVTGTIAVFTVDGSSIDTANNTVTLGFDAQCVVKGKNADLSIAKLTSDNPVDIGSMTYTAMNAMAATEIGGRFINSNATKGTKTFDITNHLNSTGVTYFALYTYTGREQAISDFTLTTTPVYTATVNVTDGTDPVAGATVTLKSGENTVATQTSAETTGVATFTKLNAGTYTVEVSKDGYAAPATAPTITVGAEGTNSVNVALTAQSDPTFSVTVNTAPFASVKLNAGTSTGGTEVATQTVTANENGVATLANVPAGSYTADVTTANKYLEGKTNAAIAVVNAETPVDLTLSYKAEYANMVYGEDFSYTAGTSIIGVNETKGIITNSNALYSGMSVSVGGVNKTGGNVSPIAEGNNFGYYSAGFNVATNYTLTYNPNKKITKIAFDAALGAQTWAGGGAGSARGNDVVTLTIGNLVLTGTPSSSAETVTITDGAADNTKTATSALTPLGWARYEIEIGDDKAVTVKITPAGGATETITGLTMSADATTAVFTGSKTASFAVDNFEIYAVDATPAE